MIKKFNEFIEEGFLSKTINRAKSGDERIEDFTIYPNSKKYINLFLKNNKVDDYKSLGMKSNSISDLIHFGWTEDSFNIVMITIGILMEKYPDIDFSGKFFYSGYYGYTFDNSPHLLMLKYFGKNSRTLNTWWSATGKSAFALSDSDCYYKERPVEREDIKDAIDWLVEDFERVNTIINKNKE